MSTKSIVQKLFLKENEKAIFLNPPKDYFKKIGEIPKGVKILETVEPEMDFIQIFVKDGKELETILPQMKDKLKSKGKLWISYYKGTSKNETDINRDTINSFAASLGLKGVFIISIDDDWSALRVKKIE